GLEHMRCIRSITETDQEPRFCAAALVRWIQQISRQLFDGDGRAVGVRDWHVTRAAVYSPGDVPSKTSTLVRCETRQIRGAALQGRGNAQTVGGAPKRSGRVCRLGTR